MFSLREIEEHFDLRILIICNSKEECEIVKRHMFTNGDIDATKRFTANTAQDSYGNLYSFVSKNTLLQNTCGRRCHQIIISGSYSMCEFEVRLYKFVMPFLCGSNVPEEFLLQEYRI